MPAEQGHQHPSGSHNKVTDKSQSRALSSSYSLTVSQPPFMTGVPFVVSVEPLVTTCGQVLPGTHSEKHLSRRDRPRTSAELQAHTASGGPGIASGPRLRGAGWRGWDDGTQLRVKDGRGTAGAELRVGNGQVSNRGTPGSPKPNGAPFILIPVGPSAVAGHQSASDAAV